jgi:hypothetical protein
MFGRRSNGSLTRERWVFGINDALRRFPLPDGSHYSPRYKIRVVSPGWEPPAISGPPIRRRRLVL